MQMFQKFIYLDFSTSDFHFDYKRDFHLRLNNFTIK